MFLESVFDSFFAFSRYQPAFELPGPEAGLFDWVDSLGQGAINVYKFALPTASMK